MTDEQLLARLFPNDPAPSIIHSAEAPFPLGWNDLTHDEQQRLIALENPDA